MTKSKMSALFLVAMFVGVPTMIGCDREISKETKVRTSPDGSTKVEEKKTVEKPDGSIETKEKKTVDNK